MKEYQITKRHCQKMIDATPVVCAGCGGKIEPCETVDNFGNPTYWPACLSCHVYEYGVPNHVFQISLKMVEERHFKAYTHDEEPERESEEYEHWKRSQVRGTCRVVRDVLYFNDKLRS